MIINSCPEGAEIMLRDLFISKVRVKILEFFLTNPNKIFHVREIVRQVDEEINAVRREIQRMEKVGMMVSEWRGNRRYYRFRKDCTFYFDLLSMVSKTKGLGGGIISKKTKLGRIKYVMLSGKYVRGEENQPDQVELLVVGNIVLPELAAIVREEEAKIGRELNYTVMSEDEFNFRKRRRDPFILSILEGSRVMIIGDEEDMLEV